MEQHNECFLREMYFQLFANSRREQNLMDFKPDNPDDHDKIIRNDQSISEVRHFGQTLDKLISSFLRLAQ